MPCWRMRRRAPDICRCSVDRPEPAFPVLAVTKGFVPRPETVSQRAHRPGSTANGTAGEVEALSRTRGDQWRGNSVDSAGVSNLPPEDLTTGPAAGLSS